MNQSQLHPPIIAAIGLALLLAGCQSSRYALEALPASPKTTQKVEKPVTTPPPKRQIDDITQLLPPNDEAPQSVTRISKRDQSWSLVAVGDILMAGSALPELKVTGFASPFSHYAEILRAADVAYGNFEAPVGTKGQAIESKTYTFQMPPKVLPVLKDIGFDVFHLANNHILDFGIESLTETVDLLDQHGFGHCGAGNNADEARQPALAALPGGLTMAFVCYSNTFPEEFWATETKPGTAFGHESWVRKDVARAKQTADIVIAAFHWGAELMTEPKDYQIALATAAIEAGADAVLGHHPHVLQPIELIQGKPVAYSLGNFVFGSYSNRVKDSAILKLEGRGKTLTSIAVLPIDVYNPVVNFHPRDLSGNNAKRVATFLLGKDVQQSNRWWTQSLETPAP